MVPLRDRCSFGRFPWLISQALSVTYMAGEHRLYLERNCRLPESPAHSRRRNREESASSKGLKGQRGFGPAVEPRRKSRPRSTSLHGSSPCKCQRLSTLRWDRLPPSRPSTNSGARAGGRRLSDRRLHRWLAGTSASAPSSHGAADLLGLNRAHICVRNLMYIRHPCFAKAPQHYIHPFKLIQQDMVDIFEYIEPADVNAGCYSYRIHALHTRACIEVEANFKAILSENGYPHNADWNMRDYIRGSSQRSVQFWSVSMANKSSIVSDLHGWRTPSVSGEELQAPGKSGPQ